MHHPIPRKPVLVSAALAAAALVAQAQVVAVRTRSGETVQGAASAKSIQFDGRAVPLKDVLSIHLGAEANAWESGRISADLAAASGTDRAARDAAIAELVDIGLPALTPLLKSYKDTALAEPRDAAYYRIFQRIVTGTGDTLDRSADLLRLANGAELRGRLGGGGITVAGRQVPLADIRRIAVRRASVDRAVDVHSLRHSNQIEFLDTGVEATADSALNSTARGMVRLSWNDDTWSSGPDGLVKPGGNYKTTQFEGYTFGALTAKSGTNGKVWIVGSKASKTEVEPGRLYLAVHDNRHWQNNLGSYRVALKVTNAYDLGPAQ
jgi:hypothetical protein